MSEPHLAEAIRNSFYVDDLIIGFQKKNEAVTMCKRIQEYLKTASFHLHKWISNDNDILLQLGKEPGANNLHALGDTYVAKTLGLNWEPISDKLYFPYSSQETYRVTKRVILSETASIFDPLGIVAPCVVIAKLIIQKLWAEHLSWDESLPLSLATEWLNFKTNLKMLNKIQANRYVGDINNNTTKVHGFCDASMHAYGACIYIVRNENGKFESNLLMAKSKVAPLKKQSIPRLELCAAVLLAEMYNYLQSKTKCDPSNVTLWSDSMVVLYWLKRHPKTLKPFTGSRVDKIQSITKNINWKHVAGTENPADLISRGCGAEKLVNIKLWWHGPTWLKNGINRPKDDFTTATTADLESITNEELKSVVSLNSCTTISVLKLESYSTLNTVIKVMSYILRFVKALKEKRTLAGVVTIDERENALNYLVKNEQQLHFNDELKALNSNVTKKSHLTSLHPFIDKNGVMRVGGRLKHSALPYEAKHPIVLPAKSYLTLLIIRAEHTKLFHAGQISTLHAVRQKFWPLNGRNIVRKVIHSCVICRRAKPKIIQPQMADLPSARITECHAFQRCGTDFAGPFNLKSLPGRGGKIYKAYVAVFVCFVTRALHLELVTELSSNAFIACFRRFISRRGLPTHIYSDNGTNFVGANRELREIVESSDSIREELAKQGVQWHFIPANSPNFGGLWEAAVKRVKYHLARVVFNVTLTYEDFNTVLIQIEAILNSRPMSAMSVDPNDMIPLTPAHFLVGRPLFTAPDVDVSDTPINRLDRYKRLKAITQGFWKRWNMEYLNQLQQRYKWTKKPEDRIKVGDLVTIVDSNAPPMAWKLGRVVDLHPGPDHQIRVVSIKTSSGSVVQRAVTKVAVLPVHETQEEVPK